MLKIKWKKIVKNKIRVNFPGESSSKRQKIISKKKTKLLHVQVRTDFNTNLINSIEKNQ